MVIIEKGILGRRSVKTTPSEAEKGVKDGTLQKVSSLVYRRVYGTKVMTPVPAGEPNPEPEEPKKTTKKKPPETKQDDPGGES